MPDNEQTTREANQEKPEVDFHGAAIIDEKGREIPITEEMIQQACDELEGDEPTGC